MPERRAKRAVFKVPWASAAEIVGDDAQLRTHLAAQKGARELNAETLRRYRKAGVPIVEIGQAVYQVAQRALRTGETSSSGGTVRATTPAPEETPMSVAEERAREITALALKLHTLRDRDEAAYVGIERLLNMALTDPPAPNNVVRLHRSRAAKRPG